MAYSFAVKEKGGEPPISSNLKTCSNRKRRRVPHLFQLKRHL
jgi:hypothetical protein